ncbi:response regulator transcription factor [Mesorhizobium australicum]|uniref:response regulator transcription factor n=1 Tax=Mesorhizobium australicum TaxID=536018 RepID=UPI000A002D52
MVVEDELFIRIDIADTLRGFPGLEVIEASTAVEAWSYLRSNGPLDVLFTDHRMPGSMTGSQLAVIVQREYPE